MRGLSWGQQLHTVKQSWCAGPALPEVRLDYLTSAFVLLNPVLRRGENKEDNEGWVDVVLLEVEIQVCGSGK